MTLRQTNAKRDIAVIATLERAAFGDRSWGHGGVRDGLLGAGAQAVLAQRPSANGGLKAVGFSIWRRAAEAGEILSLGVAPSERRRGVAGALLQRTIDDAQRLGVESLFLEVRATNLAAVRLYEGVGFIEIGQRAGYYKDGEDALLMARALSGGAP